MYIKYMQHLRQYFVAYKHTNGELFQVVSENLAGAMGEIYQKLATK